MAIMGLVLAIVGGFSSVSLAIPSGSYVQTCRDINQRGQMLSAVCRTRSGNWTSSRLYVGNCQSVENIDGNLRCAAAYGLPSGSYQKTCMHCRFENYSAVLSCECLDRQQRPRYTSMYVGNCSYDISNEDGRLTCF